MHYKRLESALNKFSPLPEVDWEEAIKVDEANYTEEERAEILQHLKNPKAPSEKPSATAPQTTKKVAKYEGVIKDETFLALLNKMNGLMDNEKYPFGEFRVEVLKGERYEGLENSPVDIIGVRIKDSTPIKVTKSSWKSIRALNGINTFTTRKGVVCITDAQFATSGRIYLPL
jgi:hypothetical protein